MKRASYRHAIELIALNDEPLEMDAEAMAGFASVVVVAEIFGVHQDRVARDVVRWRVRYLAREAAALARAARTP
jgi:hypothetical protein